MCGVFGFIEVGVCGGLVEVVLCVPIRLDLEVWDVALALGQTWFFADCLVGERERERERERVTERERVRERDRDREKPQIYCTNDTRFKTLHGLHSPPQSLAKYLCTVHINSLYGGHLLFCP